MEPSNQSVEPKRGLSSTVVVVIVLVVVALGLLAAYFYSQGGLGKGSTKPTTQTSSVDSLRSDLDALNAGDVSSDFSEVDRDLQSL